MKAAHKRILAIACVKKNKKHIIDKRSPVLKKGGECHFIPIDNKWGVKIFCEGKMERDAAYSFQKKAARHNLGPNVGPTFQVMLGRQTYYGYITEIVETPYQGCYYTQHFIAEDAVNADRQTEELWDQYREEEEQLREELETKIGFSFWDSFPPNWGLKNGKLICIDFGRHY